MLPDQVALVHLNQFAERVGDEIKQALTEAQAQGADIDRARPAQ